MHVRDIVYTEVRTIAQQQHIVLPALRDDMSILESGLDSLCIAILIARLDDLLSVNPFDRNDAEIPVTFGDLVKIYENAGTPA